LLIGKKVWSIFSANRSNKLLESKRPVCYYIPTLLLLLYLFSREKVVGRRKECKEKTGEADQMIPLKYEGDVFRPPSEARSLILQATIGCSHNRCTFCAMYKKKKYRERSLEEINSDITLAAGYYPRTRRVFLADGNALAMATGDLLQILNRLNQTFPLLERVTLYGNPQDLLLKSESELTELGQNKLKMIYLGVESGRAEVLKTVKKGVTPADLVKGAVKLKRAGIPLSVTVLNGLAGLEGTVEHARSSAGVLNEMDPEYIGLLSLIPVPGTTTHRRFKSGELTALDSWQLLEEIRMMVEDLNLTNSVFRANHASNYLPLKATLSRDKGQLLKLLDQIIANRSPSTLKSEFLRGL
jgi:radical SAM superfamily enzyme YgiQ (UPF0313 family)